MRLLWGVLDSEFSVWSSGRVRILSPILALIGAGLMVTGLFVPYAYFHSGGVSEFSSIIDVDDLSYFYLGLDVLVAAVAAAAIPFLLRGSVLRGALLITIGTLSGLSFVSYVVSPLRGGDDDFYLRPGAIIGVVGALLVIAAGVVELLTRATAPVAAAPSTRPVPPLQPPPGWYPDPSGSAGQRYWDGTSWSNETR